MWTWNEAKDLFHPRHQASDQYQSEIHLLVQTLCQNTAAALLLQMGDYCFLPLSKWVTDKNILLWQVVSVCSHFLSTEVNLFLPYFSLYGAFLKNALQKDCS